MRRWWMQKENEASALGGLRFEFNWQRLCLELSHYHWLAKRKHVSKHWSRIYVCVYTIAHLHHYFLHLSHQTHIHRSCYCTVWNGPTTTCPWSWPTPASLHSQTAQSSKCRCAPVRRPEWTAMVPLHSEQTCYCLACSCSPCSVSTNQSKIGLFTQSLIFTQENFFLT